MNKPEIKVKLQNFKNLNSSKYSFDYDYLFKKGCSKQLSG